MTLNGIFPFTPAPFPKISPYVVAGDPKSALLPRVESKPPGNKGDGDHRVQAYNFRVCLTDIPENRVPFTKPANYNPLDYELLARHIATAFGLWAKEAAGRIVRVTVNRPPTVPRFPLSLARNRDCR
jgi:hypothetical protein